MKKTGIVLKGLNYASPHTESVEIMMSHSVLASSGVTFGPKTTLENFVPKTL